MPLVALVVGFALSLAQDSEGPAVDLGGPLIVGEVVIPEKEIKRYLIYGPGRADMEYHRAQALIDREIERRTRENQDGRLSWRELQVSERELTAALEAQAAEFVRDYPTLDLEAEIRRAHRSRAWYERGLRQELQFDRVFLHDDPDRWPAVTHEAFTEEAGLLMVNDWLVRDWRENYERRKKNLGDRRDAWEERLRAGDPLAGSEPQLGSENRMYRGILRRYLRDHLSGQLETRIDGLPARFVCTMDLEGDGTPELVLRTHELWESVAPYVWQEEVRRARRFAAIVEATRQRLANEGKLLDREEALERWGGREDGLPSFIDVSSWSPRSSFPSREAEFEYERLLESFDASLRPMLEAPGASDPPAELEEYLDHASAVMGRAKVDVEMILVSAFDFPGCRWKEGGWERAAEKASLLARQLEASPDEWPGALDEHSEFWAPPDPPGERRRSNPLHTRGRFGPLAYRDVRGILSDDPRGVVYESRCSSFLDRDSLTDLFFFEQPVGSIGGPYRGPWGYYLVRVLGRKPEVRPLNPDDPRHLSLLRDSWIQTRFVEYAHDALRSTEVRGSLERR